MEYLLNYLDELEKKLGSRTRVLIFISVIIHVSICAMSICSYGMQEPQIAYEGMNQEDAESRLYAAGMRKSRIETLKGSKLCELLVTPHWIAVGTKDNQAGIFDLNGALIYAVRFTTTGGYRFLYDPDSDGLVIRIARNETYYHFDSSGNLIKMTDISCSEEGLEQSYETDEQGNRYELKQFRTIKDFWLYQYGQLVQKGERERVFLESKFYIDPAPIALFLIMILGGVGAYMGSKRL